MDAQVTVSRSHNIPGYLEEELEDLEAGGLR